MPPTTDFSTFTNDQLALLAMFAGPTARAADQVLRQRISKGDPGPGSAPSTGSQSGQALLAASLWQSLDSDQRAALTATADAHASVQAAVAKVAAVNAAVQEAQDASAAAAQVIKVAQAAVAPIASALSGGAAAALQQAQTSASQASVSVQAASDAFTAAAAAQQTAVDSAQAAADATTVVVQAVLPGQTSQDQPVMPASVTPVTPGSGAVTPSGQVQPTS